MGRQGDGLETAQGQLDRSATRPLLTDSLDFDVVDRPATHALQKRLGLDANPWRTFPRAITSFDYLKQDDILEQFRAVSRPAAGSPHLPWDLADSPD